MESIGKALSILTLFASEDSQWTVEAAAARLGLPISTSYRYFRCLADAGLIVAFAAGRYVIGPGIIELDRMARRNDPLIVAAKVPMDQLGKHDPDRSVVLLARLYHRRVMCVDQRPHGHEPLTLSYERGRPMPLYRGSLSKIILANLPPQILTRYYADDHDEIAKAGLGARLAQFRDNLRVLRKAGACTAFGEVDKGVIGIAAPVVSPEGDVFASLGIVIPDHPDDRPDLPELTRMVIEAARQTSNALTL